jgi:hypothetical protein
MNDDDDDDVMVMMVMMMTIQFSSFIYVLANSK